MCDKVTRRCPQTTTSEEKGEPKQIRTVSPRTVPLLTTEPNALPLGQTGSVTDWVSEGLAGNRQARSLTSLISISFTTGAVRWPQSLSDDTETPSQFTASSVVHGETGVCHRWADSPVSDLSGVFYLHCHVRHHTDVCHVTDCHRYWAAESVHHTIVAAKQSATQWRTDWTTAQHWHKSHPSDWNSCKPWSVAATEEHVWPRDLNLFVVTSLFRLRYLHVEHTRIVQSKLPVTSSAALTSLFDWRSSLYSVAATRRSFSLSSPPWYRQLWQVCFVFESL